MDALARYKNFLNGRHFSEGLRVTVGVILPSVLLSYLGDLTTGLTLSLAALSVSITDVPGPAKHRANGMGICVFLVSAMALLAGYASKDPVLLTVLITLAGFIFSMLTVYGMRSSALGVSVLYVMAVSIDDQFASAGILERAFLTFIGASWYYLYSITLSRIRPFKIIKQVMGDLILAISDYLRKRSELYQPDPALDSIYRQFLRLQINIEEQQALASELIFKTRNITRETSHVARVLVKTYLDTTDMLESIMTTYQSYDALHRDMRNFGILEDVGEAAELLANEMQSIGIALKSETASIPDPRAGAKVVEVREKFESLRQRKLSPDKIETFLNLGRIVHNLEDLQKRVEALHYQTSFDKDISTRKGLASVNSHLVQEEDIRLSLFLTNLNYSSNIFRHSLRVALSLLAGYLLAQALQLGHGSWILITIIVILKPAYSLTRQRNKDRLMGTVVGAITAMALLYFINDKTVLLILMMLLLLGCNSLIRTNYFLAVFMLTPALLILFHLMYPGSLSEVFSMRLIDTAIGSGIAFFSNLAIKPAWEHEGMRGRMADLLKHQMAHFEVVANAFTDKEIQISELRKIRRNVLLNLSNLSDAFHRMLSEPKRYQKGMDVLHRFIVISYSFSSHMATLSYMLQHSGNGFKSVLLQPVMQNIRTHLQLAFTMLKEQKHFDLPQKHSTAALEAFTRSVVDKRREELNRGELETSTKSELVNTKSVTDQFFYLQNLSETLFRLSRDYSTT